MKTDLVHQYNDHLFGNLIPLLAGRPVAEAMLKEASVEEGDYEALPSSAFAWEDRRAFAIHTKEATVMSRLYREKCANVPQEVDQALAAACDLFGIPETVFHRAKVAAAPVRPEDYLLPSLQRLKVTSADEVKTAEKKLLEGFQQLTIEHRAEACGRLIEKAASYKVTLDPLMHQLAGYTVSSTAALKDWLGARKEASAKPEHKNAFAKLAAALDGRSPEMHHRPTLIALADTIAELDKRAGLTQHYDRKLPDPLQTVFNTTKVASACVDLGGKMVPITRLAQFSPQFFGDALGDEFMREAGDGKGGVDVQKAAMLIETLPRDLRNSLAQQMGPYLR